MFKDSYLYYRWEQQTVKPPSNDFVIAISASGKSTMSRTGKTTLETFLAEQMDLSSGGFDAGEKATVDAGKLAYDIVPEVENHSAVALEEAQGMAGSVGLDRRRGQVQEAIDAINAILNNGDKELTIIITSQHLPMLDKRVPPIVDAWLLIRHGPSSPDGPRCIHHGMYVDDYNFDNPKIRTPGFEEFAWPKVSETNENYQVLERKKQEHKKKNRDTNEEAGELSLFEQALLASRLYDMYDDITWTDVPALDERLTYNGDYLRREAKKVLSENGKPTDGVSAD